MFSLTKGYSPLLPAITWQDTRCLEEANKIDSLIPTEKNRMVWNPYTD